MRKRTPGLMLPTMSSAKKRSITDEEMRQRKGNTSKGRTHERSPTHACSSRKLTYEEISQITAARRNMSGRPTLPSSDDQNNNQHAKSTLKLSDNDWISYISDQIDREYPSASRSPEFPDENLKYTLTDQYNRSHHLAKSTLESPGDNWNPSHSDHYNREYPYSSSSQESSNDNFDILEPPCQQMPRTDYDLSNALSRLRLLPTREHRPSHPTSGVESTHDTKDIWLSDTTKGRTKFDVQANENVAGLLFTERNPDPFKTFVEGESGHRPISPVRKEPLIYGSSNGEDYSYKNTRDSATSASLLHDNHRSTSRTNIDLQISAPSVHNDSLPSPSSVRISETSLEDENLRSLSQTKTDFRRSLSFDAKDKEKKQEKSPMRPQSKTKVQKPESATIKTSNDSTLQDDDDSFSSLPDNLASSPLFVPKTAADNKDDDDSAITSASLLHKNQRSPSSANKDLRISETSLQDDNLRSPLQTKTDFQRSLTYDVKDKAKNQEKTFMHLLSKTKPRRPKLCENLLFYQGKIKSKPAPGYTIETMLELFCDDDFIEKYYPYCIKWLFPIPNKSFDRNTQELLPHEIKAIQKDKETASRVIKAFLLVLDYYGIIMVNTETGELMKSRNWKNRWSIINTNNEHEFKHITRVLVSLGALGYERYQVPLIEIFIKNKDDIKEFDWNSIRHWIENVNDEGQQQALFEKYGKKIFSLETLDAYNAQTKHEQHSEYDNTLEHLGTIGS